MGVSAGSLKAATVTATDAITGKTVTCSGEGAAITTTGLVKGASVEADTFAATGTITSRTVACSGEGAAITTTGSVKGASVEADTIAVSGSLSAGALTIGNVEVGGTLEALKEANAKQQETIDRLQKMLMSLQTQIDELRQGQKAA